MSFVIYGKGEISSGVNGENGGIGFLVDDFVEQEGELAGFGVDAGTEGVEIALEGAEFVGEVEAGKDGYTGGVDVAGAGHDVAHALVHRGGGGFEFRGIARRAQRVRLVADRHADRFRRHGIEASLR